MNNPTPSMSSLPSVAASGSSAGGVPLYTPPQTPGYSYHVSNGSTGSATGVAVGGSLVAGVKRESVVSEMEAEEDGGNGREKRRRIAPTLVSDGRDGPGASGEGG